jgi:excisionase family DNA binding protein
MKTQRDENTAPVLIDVKEAARRLGTEPRFVRRLIAERRIEFHKLGRYVRISEAALADFIKAGRVEPLTAVDAQHKVRGAALCLTGKDIDVSAMSGSGNPAVSRSATRGRTGACGQVLTPTAGRATPRGR